MDVEIRSLGTHLVGRDWTIFGDGTQSELFRFTHVFGTLFPGGYILFAQWFGDAGSFYGVRRIYPSRDNLMLDMRLPPGFRDAGLSRRALAVRQGSVFRNSNVEPWRATIAEVNLVP